MTKRKLDLFFRTANLGEQRGKRLVFWEAAAIFPLNWELSATQKKNIFLNTLLPAPEKPVYHVIRTSLCSNERLKLCLTKCHWDLASYSPLHTHLISFSYCHVFWVEKKIRLLGKKSSSWFKLLWSIKPGNRLRSEMLTKSNHWVLKTNT